MIIRNSRIVLENKVVRGSLRIKGSRIVAVSRSEIPPLEGEELIDTEDSYVMPGFVDLHTHGSGGFDFMDGEVSDITGAARSLAVHGTTTCLPTLLTSSDEDLFLFLRNFRKAVKKSGYTVTSKMPGIHLEGPYFSMTEKGAQDPRYIRTPDKAHYMKIIEAADGSIIRWSVAPELDGALEMINALSKEGVLISGGHTAATYEDVTKAYDLGMKMLTHFYSGMSSITRHGGFRVLGTVEAGYLIDDLYLELIGDGMHLPPELLKLIFRFKRHDRITVCSDSMRGAAMGCGPSILGSKANGTPVIIEDGIAKMPDRTCFAGSVATGDVLARTLHRIVGLEMEEVSRITSFLPAGLIGISDETGSIAEGKKADLVICDDNINIKSVFVDGKRV